MNAHLKLIELCPNLKGMITDDGFLAIHSKYPAGQRSSIAALDKCHQLGWNFDILTIDGTQLNDVNLNHCKVLLEYETEQFSVLPGNGISKWRLSSQRNNDINITFKSDFTKWEGDPEKMFIKGASVQADLYHQMFQPVEERVPHYANDKYKREIKPGVFIDVYDIIRCYEVTSGPLQHALKKILAAGQRGHKDYEQDLIDILSSTERALFQHQEEKSK